MAIKITLWQIHLDCLNEIRMQFLIQFTYHAKNEFSPGSVFSTGLIWLVAFPIGFLVAATVNLMVKASLSNSYA